MKAPKATAFHIPVMYQAVAEWAAGSRRAVDATAGGGGHTALLRAAGALVLAIDRDPAALAAAQAALGSSGITWLEASFASDQALAAVREFRPDRILLDLGVSSHQLDDEARGFSFRPGAPLDMRMTPGKGPRGADVLNTWSEELLETAFRDSADEPRARALARAVVRRRRRAAFTTSDDFVNAIREVLGPRSGPSDFARLFQAVRIVVNGELDRLARALPDLFALLEPGGIMAVIAYHSGEDRIVKHQFREWARACTCPPEQPVCTCGGKAKAELLTKKSITAGDEEVARNPRARSAHLRAVWKAAAA